MVCTFFSVFFNTVMFSFLITRQKKQFAALYTDLTMPVKKRDDLSSLGSPFIEKFPQNPQADCPSELTDEDQIICLCLSSREARKKCSDIFHIYNGTLTLPTENEKSSGRWFKCVK